MQLISKSSESQFRSWARSNLYCVWFPLPLQASLVSLGPLGTLGPLAYLAYLACLACLLKYELVVKYRVEMASRCHEV